MGRKRTKENQKDVTSDETIKEYKKDTPLKNEEFLLYLGCWIFIFILGYFSMYLYLNQPSNKVILDRFPKYETFFGIQIPDSEMSWNTAIKMINMMFKPTIIYLMVSFILRRFSNSNIFMIGCSFASIYLEYSMIGSAISIQISLIIFLIVGCSGFLKTRLIAWALTINFFVYWNYYYEEIFPTRLLNYAVSNMYLMRFIRSISIAVYISKSSKWNSKLILEMFYYFWYFPTILSFRLMVIGDFIEQIYVPYVIPSKLKWLLHFFKTIFYMLVWNCVVAVCPISFIYNYLDIITADVKLIAFSTPYIGIMEYMTNLIPISVIYLVCQLDGYLSAPPPQCAYRTALYSSHWRYFDVDYHWWIKQEIFRPISTLKTSAFWRYFAAIPSFGFVMIHLSNSVGYSIYTIVNCVQLYLEHFFNYIYKHTKVGEFLENNFSPMFLRRLVGAIGGLSSTFSSYGMINNLISAEIANEAFHHIPYMFLEWKREHFEFTLWYLFLNYLIGNIGKQVSYWTDKRNKK